MTRAFCLWCDFTGTTPNAFMKSSIHRIVFAGIVTALIVAPAAFAGMNPTVHPPARFWNFPSAEVEARHAISASRAEKITRFTPRGADLGNFILTLSSSRAPIGFNARIFAMRIDALGELDTTLAARTASSFSTPLFDTEMASRDLMFSSANQLDISPNRVPPPDAPEPGTFFGAAAAALATGWMQRRRLARLLSGRAMSSHPQRG